MAVRLFESGISSGWKVECFRIVKKMGMDAALELYFRRLNRIFQARTGIILQPIVLLPFSAESTVEPMRWREHVDLSRVGAPARAAVPARLDIWTLRRSLTTWPTHTTACCSQSLNLVANAAPRLLVYNIQVISLKISITAFASPHSPLISPS